MSSNAPPTFNYFALWLIRFTGDIFSILMSLFHLTAYSSALELYILVDVFLLKADCTFTLCKRCNLLLLCRCSCCFYSCWLLLFGNRGSRLGTFAAAGRIEGRWNCPQPLCYWIVLTETQCLCWLNQTKAVTVWVSSTLYFYSVTKGILPFRPIPQGEGEVS